jgi:gamma-glutamylcyclotransferase (GGCT)/AIG2-like uncharacterized protein YtfP
MSDLLFAYGTLRKGNSNAMAKYLAAHARFVADGWFQGRMFQISYYPGVIASNKASDRVYGEIYQLNDQDSILKLLDDYEECNTEHAQPAEYRRESVSISTMSGDVYEAVWIYLYQWPVQDKALIEHGDFMNMGLVK